MAGSAKGPNVSGGQGTITVQGLGAPNEAIKIVVRQGGTEVSTQTGNLDGTGNGSYTFQGLAAAAYDVTVIAPSPNGTIYDFPGVVVS
jgi:hypothetical protein